MSAASGNLARAPAPALRPFVEMLWAVDRTDDPPGQPRERVLPTGAMHLVMSLTGEPFHIFAADARSAAQPLASPALVGGARSGPYLRELPGPRRSVGVQLRPGACEWLVGLPAAELSEAHTPLDALWGASAEAALQRVAEAGEPEATLQALESLVAARLPRLRGLHPAVAHALDRFEIGRGVGDTVRETGYSHRRFIALFRGAVGLTPGRYCRVLRFRRALRLLGRQPPMDLASLAQDAGYSDQAHLSRELRELAGMSPVEYRRVAPHRAHHVPLRSG